MCLVEIILRTLDWHLPGQSMREIQRMFCCTVQINLLGFLATFISHGTHHQRSHRAALPWCLFMDSGWSWLPVCIISTVDRRFCTSLLFAVCDVVVRCAMVWWWGGECRCWFLLLDALMTGSLVWAHMSLSKKIDQYNYFLYLLSKDLYFYLWDTTWHLIPSHCCKVRKCTVLL